MERTNKNYVYKKQSKYLKEQIKILENNEEYKYGKTRIFCKNLTKTKRKLKNIEKFDSL